MATFKVIFTSPRRNTHVFVKAQFEAQAIQMGTFFFVIDHGAELISDRGDISVEEALYDEVQSMEAICGRRMIRSTDDIEVVLGAYKRGGL